MMNFEAIPDPEQLKPEPGEQAAALAQAELNALRRLLRCLFAEGLWDAAQMKFDANTQSATLPLGTRSEQLRFERLWAAPAGTYLNQASIQWCKPGQAPRDLRSSQQLIDLLDPSASSAEGLAALRTDVANSVANDAQARLHRQAWKKALASQISQAACESLPDYLRQGPTLRAALMLDQWGALEGHPFYPTWKSKPALSPAQVAALSPEFGARVRVRIAALRADNAYIERMSHVSSLAEYFAAEFPALWQPWCEGLRRRGLDASQWLPLPIHGWHLENFVRQGFAQEIEAGLLITEGPELLCAPTMSFRTLMPMAPDGAPMIKLPMALWLTGEQRSLQAKSIHMGPRISELLQRILKLENGFDGGLEIFAEEVAFHYRNAHSQEDAPGRFLSVAFRQSRPALGRQDGLLPVPVAALFSQSPLSPRPLITELIEGRGPRASAATVQAFFRRYARVITRPCIALYLLYGIGLEAHQQNSTVLFDAEGQPCRLLMRDFGDGRSYAPLLEARGLSLAPYVHKGILPTVFRDSIAPVRNLLIHAGFVCHLHELALLLSEEYHLGDKVLWSILREETAAAFDAVRARVTDPAFWQDEREHFLQQPWPCRSLLSMHLQRYRDYRLQHLLANPLAQATP